MVAGFLDRFFVRPTPVAARFRGLIRQHPIVAGFARGVLQAGRGLLSILTTSHWRVEPSVKLQAVMAARGLGGCIGTFDLARSWDFCRRGRRTLCFAGPLELKQIETILRAKRVRRIVRCTSAAEARELTARLDRFDRVVIAAHPEVAGIAGEWESAILDASKLLVLREVEDQSLRRVNLANSDDACSMPRLDNASVDLARKLRNGESLTIVCVNDVGFQYGAGIAMRRQAASFLLNGWRVGIVAWSPGPATQPPHLPGCDTEKNWLGVRGLDKMHGGGASDEQILSAVVSTVSSLSPDVIIVENIHGAGWPLALVPAFAKLAPTAVYMHDCYWVTGRCAHAGSCELYKTGCDARCPTAQMYPPLAPDKIAPAWMLRGDIFGGPGGMPLIANSSWTQDYVRKRFGDLARTEVVHLGLDHQALCTDPQKAGARASRRAAGQDGHSPGVGQHARQL